MKKALLILALAALCVPASAQWLYYTDMPLPTASPNIASPLCLEADEARDVLYIGTFNQTGGAADRYVVRLTVSSSDPTTGVLEQIYARSCPNGRGITGLAYDPDSDTLYVSANSDGAPGNQWVDTIAAPHTGAAPTVTANWLTPAYRNVGCALAKQSGGTYLYLAQLDGPKVHVVNTATKAEDAATPTFSATFARDLVVDPVSYDIFANRNGNLHRFTGGSPTNVAGYGAGADVSPIPSANTNLMQFSSGCYLSYNNLWTTPQVVWNSGNTAGGDRLFVTNLDGTFDKDEELYPTGSPTNTAWVFATDSATLSISGQKFLYVADLSATVPRIVVFSDTTAVDSWELFN